MIKTGFKAKFKTLAKLTWHKISPSRVYNSIAYSYLVHKLDKL